MVHSCLSRVSRMKKKSNQIRSLNNICLPVWLDMLVTQCYFRQPLLWMVVIEKGGIEWWNNFDDCTALSEIFRGSQFSCYENIFMIRISLIKVLDAILMGRQSGQKLQYLYGNPMTDNFTQFENHNVKILSRTLYSPSLAWRRSEFSIIHLQIFSREPRLPSQINRKM